MNSLLESLSNDYSVMSDFTGAPQSFDRSEIDSVRQCWGLKIRSEAPCLVGYTASKGISRGRRLLETAANVSDIVQV